MATWGTVLACLLMMAYRTVVCESQDIEIGSKDRRLLLNDPSTLLSHIEALQQEMASLKSEVNTLKTDVNTCKVEVNTLNLEVYNQKMETNTCKSELNTLSMKVNSLNTTVNNQTLALNTYKTEVNTLNTEVTKLNTEVSSQRTQVHSLQSQLINRNPGGTGSVYTVWVRKSCPAVNGTTTVYTGITGGNAYNDHGGGVDTLCLPHNPDDAPNDFPTRKGSQSYLYGSEYEFNYRKFAQNDDVPCAVCHADTAPSVLMIPAKSTCPSGWNIQYSGYLVSDANADGFLLSDYVCLHNDAEYLTEGARLHNENGHILYPVQASCGSLPCPPYRNGQYITCVVCTL